MTGSEYEGRMAEPDGWWFERWLRQEARRSKNRQAKDRKEWERDDEMLATAMR